MIKLQQILKAAHIDLDPALFTQEEDSKRWTLKSASLERFCGTREIYIDTHNSETLSGFNEVAMIFWQDDCLVINLLMMPVGISFDVLKEFQIRISEK